MNTGSYTGLGNNGYGVFLSGEYLNQKLDTQDNRSIISILPIQPTYGESNTLFRALIEDLEDPEWLSGREIREIFSSLNEFANGNFKEGGIDDLLQDLDSI